MDPSATSHHSVDLGEVMDSIHCVEVLQESAAKGPEVSARRLPPRLLLLR